MRKIRAFIFLLFFCSCAGGGSSGTGTIAIQGSLRTNDNKAISSAKINVSGDDNQVQTDENGNFLLNVSADEGQDGIILLEIESDGEIDTVEVQTTNTMFDSSSTIKVEIKIDPEDQLIVVNQLEVEAKIVGSCDLYFENLSTIRQSNKTPEEINCTLKVSIKADGKPLKDVPFVLEYTGCSETQTWNLLAAGETRSAPVPGDGQLEFKYFDNTEKCVYRVISPYNLIGVTPVITEIHTFTKQEYDKVTGQGL